ncbi:MAG: restriction endonuclease subunit S [Syntrophomonadaceae bacterium]|jgi:type I restriction enzyme S subunit|nr:restriction endonuclease subunit S [Syntrophomonadaceae bacterium]
MEVRKGYKQTEVGVIPEQWEEIILDEICNIKRGASPRPIERFVTDTYEGVNWIRIGDVDKSGVIKETQQKITKEGKEKSVFVNKGDLLLSNSMSFGKPYLLEIDGCIHDGWLAISEKKNAISKKYLYYYLMSTKARSFFEIMSAGSGVQNLKKETVSKLKVAVPNDSEQQAISIALSDIDGLISSLTKIINKKKNIKQGAMQELLTGKKRLEGFGGEWKQTPISIMGKIYGGMTGKTKTEFGHGESKYIPFMNIMINPIIDKKFLESVKIGVNEFQNTVEVGDLLFNTSSETPEEVGMCSVLLDEIERIYLNSFCFGFRIDDLTLFNPLFLSYLFRSNVGRQLMLSLAQGATRYNLSKNNFNKLVLRIPIIEEQTTIANILSDMDDEIEKLEQKLDKYKAIKQGMMQELLTGRIRLVGEGTQ